MIAAPSDTLAPRTVTAVARATRNGRAWYADATLTLPQGERPTLELYATAPIIPELVLCEAGETALRLTCPADVLPLLASALLAAVDRAGLSPADLVDTSVNADYGTLPRTTGGLA